MGVLKLTIEYDGAGFSGWAAQPQRRTVEETLGAAFEQVTRSAVALSVAGRTDAGVHAWGQVASVELDAPDPVPVARSLNGVLPGDVSVTRAERAPDGFDARRDALSRTYCYRVLARPAPSPFERGRALWWPHRVDEAALERCAAMLRGRHDFTAFTLTQTHHVWFDREIHRAEWRRTGDVLELWIEADAFMRHMVRALVGTMLDVAGGRRTSEAFAALLEGGSRSEAGDTVAAHGLYLASVRY